MRTLLLVAGVILLLSACSHRIIVEDCKPVQDDKRWVCTRKAIP